MKDTTDIALSIRTSDEEISNWDRSKIVEALLRETNIKEQLAEEISIEVEDQIFSSKIKTITTSLVRELVNAKLIEQGLEKERLKHDRLGVPIYDVDEMMVKPNLENANVPHGPEATNLTLAGIIKKDYALRRVFSKDVTNAHVKGDIHLHDLTMPDRNYCSGQSLEYIKKFGLNLPNSLAVAKPAIHPEVLLAHMVKFSASLQCHYAGAIGWDAVNLFFAPYLVDLSKEKIYQIAQMLVYEFSQQAVARGGQSIFSDINLYWEIPKHFENTPAIGPGGKYTGKTYKEYEKESQNFVWALLDVYKEGDASGRPFFFPKPNLHITEKFFQTPGHEKFLNHVCSVASKMGNPYFLFDRGKTAKISECCRLSFTLDNNDLQDAKTPWKMRYCAIQNITLNLPRIGLITKGDKIFDRITKLFSIVVKAHHQKQRFIERILSLGDKGPLALLTMNNDGDPYFKINKVSHLVGMLGLNELVKTQTGCEMHESEQAFKYGLKVIAHLKLLADQANKENPGMHFVLEQTPAECCHYDQNIQLVIDNKLKIIKIGEFVDKFLEKEGSYIVSDLKTLTVNDDLKAEFLPITRLYKHKRKSNVFKIVLESKRELQITDCHSVCTLENGVLVSKPLYEFKIGDYIVRSRNNPFNFLQVENSVILNKKHIILDPKFSFFLGHLIGDGSVFEDYISLRSTTKELILYLKSIADNIFGKDIFTFRKMSPSKKQTKYCYEIICYDNTFNKTFKEILKLESGCRNVKIPEIILSTPKECIIYFLKGLYLTDGSLYINCQKNDKNIKISTSSKNLIPGLYILFSRLNIETKLCALERHSETHDGIYYDLLLRGEDVDNFLALIKDNNNFIAYKFNNKKSIKPCKKLPDITKLVANVRKELGVSFSTSSFNKFGLKNKFSMIRHAEKGIHNTTFHGLQTVINTYTTIENVLNKKSITLDTLRNILNSDIVFDKIVSMEKLINQPEYVYDIEVDKTHRFVDANGILLHNSTSYRFARLDLKYYPERATQIVQGNIEDNEVYYTNSTQLSTSLDIDPITRIKKEGLFHSLIEAGALTHIFLGEHQPSPESMANFVVKVFKHTKNDQIAFSPEFTCCFACKRTERGLLTKCPHCGDKNVEQITRITGYFSKVSSWNKGKLAELKDRRRYKI